MLSSSAASFSNNDSSDESSLSAVLELRLRSCQHVNANTTHCCILLNIINL